MKKIISISLLLLILLCHRQTQAQTFGNEWINAQQTYYKIPIAERGIYRISFSQLQQIGFPTSVNPTSIQLFHRGKEQAIYVEGEQDNKAAPTDFIEFYGIKNDGTQDSVFYFTSKKPINKYFNLYSDSTAYFLTWRLDGGKGKRMEVYQENNTTQLKSLPYHNAEVLSQSLADYATGNSLPIGLFNWDNIFYSHYDDGEGYSSGAFTTNQKNDITFRLDNVIKTAIKPTIEWQMVGRSPVYHQVEYWAGKASSDQRLIDTQRFWNYDPYLVKNSIDTSDIATNGQLVLSTVSRNTVFTNQDLYAYTYIKINFQQAWKMGGVQTKDFGLPKTNTDKAFVSITQVPTNAQLYDISDRNTLRRIGTSYNNGQLDAMVKDATQDRSLFVTNDFKRVPTIRKVSLRKPDPQKVQYLMVSHPTLMKEVRTYASYRASVAGGGYDTLVFTTEEACNLFNYGEWSVTGVRNMANYFYSKGNAKFLFLVGTSWWSHRVRYAANRYDIDMIPCSGWPGADEPMVMGLGKDPQYYPSLALGRLNTNSPQTVLDYLNKVKEHESSTGLWRKTLLHLSGGKTASEITLFKEYVADFEQIAKKSKHVGTKTVTLSKSTDQPVETFDVTKEVNAGVGLITFFGHSSSTVSDINIGYCSDPQKNYQNKGRYPAIIMNGCGSGNFYLGEKTFGSDWINTPNKGAILFLADAYTGYIFPLKGYSTHIYQTLFTDSIYTSKPFGLVRQEAVKRYLKANSTFYEIAHAEQLVLQGDPAVALFPNTKPDYTPTAMFAKPYNNAVLTASVDSFKLGIVVANLGSITQQTTTFSLRRTLSNGQVINYGKIKLNPVAYQDTLYLNIPNKGFPTSKTTIFDIKIDDDNVIAELNETNNQNSLIVYLDPTAVPPANNANPVLEVTFDGRVIQQGEIVSPNPIIQLRLKDENGQLARTDTTGIDWWIKMATTGAKLERINWKSPLMKWSVNTQNEFIATYTPQNLPDGDSYLLQAQGRDMRGNAAGSVPYTIGFKVKRLSALDPIQVYPNPLTVYTKFVLKIAGSEAPSEYSLNIYNPSGQLLRSINQQDQTLRIGTNELYWDGTDANHQALAAGLYLYKISFNNSSLPTQQGKIVVLK